MDEDYNSEEEQKLDNQVKKLKIELETGAKFFTPDGSDLPVDIEAQFLDHIIAFEEAAKNQEVKTIGEILGNPELVPEEELSDEQIHEALTNFFSLMEKNNMELDIIYETPEREIYRFISTEFLAQENEMISMPGMTSHFIYEEFVPNDVEDLKKDSEKILGNIFTLDFEYFNVELAQEMKHKGKVMTADEYIDILKIVHEERSLELTDLEVLDVEIDSDNEDATVTCQIKYSSQFTKEKESVVEDKVTLHFIRKYDFWGADIITIPSLGL